MATRKTVNLKATCSKTGAKRAVVNPVTITGPVDITVTFLDDTGAPITGISDANCTSTLVSDNPDVTFTQVSSLAYKGSIAVGPSGPTGVANLTLTANVVTPPAGPFTATCVATLDIPAPPTPTPVDVTIVITPSPVP